MNQNVTDYIQGLTQDWQIEVCTRLRQLIHDAIPGVDERLQYGKPHFLQDGKYACVVAAAKDWVTLTLFNAASLQAPDGVFEPGGSDRKSIKIRPDQTVDYALVAKLVRQSSEGGTV